MSRFPLLGAQYGRPIECRQFTQYSPLTQGSQRETGLNTALFPQFRPRRGSGPAGLAPTLPAGFGPICRAESIDRYIVARPCQGTPGGLNSAVRLPGPTRALDDLRQPDSLRGGSLWFVPACCF